jgi:GNAT superfamily N-acetyltransferase
VSTEHVPVRVAPATDPQRYAATDWLVWFQEVSQSAEEQLTGLGEQHRFAASVPDQDDDTYAGVYGVFPLELAVPHGDEARLVPCAGLTWVGVHPDHRRRGVLTAMMVDHLERTRESGLALSALHASEPAIYGRFGYGLASLELQVEVARGARCTAPYLEDAAAGVRTRIASLDDPGMPGRRRACDRRVATLAPGGVVPELGYFERVCRLPPSMLRDKEVPRVLFAQRRDGDAWTDVGYAVLQRSHKWEKERPGGEVEVQVLHGDPAARLVLLRRLVDLDLMATVRLTRVGVDDPLLAWAGDGPRATADIDTYDSAWVRLVDLGAAWRSRTYAGACDVVVEVRDTAAPWNAGRWRLVATDDGAGEAERTTAEADVRLDVAVLGAGYLGRGVAGLLRAGLVDQQRPGAWASLAAAMRTPLEPDPAIGF